MHARSVAPRKTHPAPGTEAAFSSQAIGGARERNAAWRGWNTRSETGLKARSSSTNCSEPLFVGACGNEELDSRNVEKQI